MKRLHRTANLTLAYILISLSALATCSWAKETCLVSPAGNVPEAKDVPIPASPYTVGICYLPEKKLKTGAYDEYFHNIIELKKHDKRLARKEVPSHITVGRISDLKLEKSTKRFAALSYVAGEFCNGLIVFDLKAEKAAFQQGCVSDSDQCHVTELSDSTCKAKIECRDQGAEGEPPTRKTPIIKEPDLCKT
jgi:hypothetical protein